MMARVVDQDAKRLTIITAAAGCFARQGFDATSMNDIARAASVSKGSLYDYFDTKEDLFYAVFEWFNAQLMAAIASDQRAEGSAWQRLAGALEATVAGLVAHTEFYPVSLEVWAAAARTGTRERFATVMRALYRAYRDELTTMIRTAQQSGELRPDIDAVAIAGVLVGAIDGLVLQYWLDPGFDPLQRMRAFLAALLAGIRIQQGAAS